MCPATGTKLDTPCQDLKDFYSQLTKHGLCYQDLDRTKIFDTSSRTALNYFFSAES